MKIELSRIVKAATFPESIIACPLLLMNGRVNIRILSRALVTYGMGESDWTMILDKLYPLVRASPRPAGRRYMPGWSWALDRSSGTGFDF